jgi:signal transduction histidine kinase
MRPGPPSAERKLSRLPWLAGGLLVLSLAALAGLQLRWLGEVAAADRQRLEAGVANALGGLAAEVDREVSRAWLVFRRPYGPRAGERTAGELPAGEAADLLDRWRETAPFPDLVRGLWLVGGSPGSEQTGPAAALRLDGDRWVAEVPPFPVALVDRAAAEGEPPHLGDRAGDSPDRRGGRRHGRGPRGFPSLPSLVPELPGIAVPLGAAGDSPPRTLAVVFDRGYLAGELLPALTRQYLEPVLGPDLQLRVRVAASGETVYATAPDLGGGFEWSAPVFDLLAAEPLGRLAYVTGFPEPEPMDGREAGPPRHARRLAVFASLVERPAGWTLEVRPAEGSLTAALARARRGNAAVALGIIVLLGLATLALAVSARRAQEMARRQLEFTAEVSHELRTPLAAIRSLADNLADGVVSDPAQARLYGEQIARQGERLTTMVEQVLALGADEAARRRRRRRLGPVDVGALVREAAAEAAAAVPGARVETELPDTLPAVQGDPLPLRRALENLIGNALKHGGSPGSPPWARVRAAAAPGGGGLAIEVADRGPGIPAGDRERLFEPFFRGERARAGQLPGAGLGLHLVRRTAEAHGGRVEVRSAPGEGSAFTLVLPLAGPPTTDPTAEASPG